MAEVRESLRVVGDLELKFLTMRGLRGNFRSSSSLILKR
jgi:hypothetical protein